MDQEARGGVPLSRRHFVVRPFAGIVVFRNVARAEALQLWTPSIRAYRWNIGFPALYASLSLEVSLAERVKRTTTNPVELTVGEAAVVLGMVADLTTVWSRRQIGITMRDVAAIDYSVPQRIGTRARRAGPAGLLVPAAIRSVSRLYPAIAIRRGGTRFLFRTPGSGVNLVVFPDRTQPTDSVREILRYECVAQGLPVR